MSDLAARIAELERVLGAFHAVRQEQFVLEVLELVDAEGNIRATLSVHPENRVALQLGTEAGPAAALFVDPAAGPRLALGDRDEGAIEAALLEESIPTVLLQAGGKDRLTTGVAVNGWPMVLLVHEDGEPKLGLTLKE